MADKPERPKLGPYELLRPLASTDVASRWLALHESHHTSHVVYKFPICHHNSEKRRFLSAVQTACQLSHSHILKIEQYSFDPGGIPWVVTPFAGDIDGLLSLSRLLRAKGGRLHPDEAERAIIQMLQAFEYAHTLRVHHGPLAIDDVIVDRHGSLLVELFGIGRQLQGLTQGNSELARDEVRSIVEIGYQLITGLRAEAPIIGAGRLVKKLDPRWDLWFEMGLDPARGYESAEDAIAALPSKVQVMETRRGSGGVFTVLERIGLARAAAR